MTDTVHVLYKHDKILQLWLDYDYSTMQYGTVLHS